MEQAVKQPPERGVFGISEDAISFETDGKSVYIDLWSVLEIKTDEDRKLVVTTTDGVYSLGHVESDDFLVGLRRRWKKTIRKKMKEQVQSTGLLGPTKKKRYCLLDAAVRETPLYVFCCLHTHGSPVSDLLVLTGLFPEKSTKWIENRRNTTHRMEGAEREVFVEFEEKVSFAGDDVTVRSIPVASPFFEIVFKAKKEARAQCRVTVEILFEFFGDAILQRWELSEADFVFQLERRFAKTREIVFSCLEEKRQGRNLVSDTQEDFSRMFRDSRVLGFIVAVFVLCAALWGVFRRLSCRDVVLLQNSALFQEIGRKEREWRRALEGSVRGLLENIRKMRINSDI
ncbi:MAG: uncharacterized protein A8A55_0724 [Amphiamblys sp. WSBS2006]|nr:MAG: uncharacterized protein A8A55_0724 [Amphiamblys sp. WSBS2006]